MRDRILHSRAYRLVEKAESLWGISERFPTLWRWGRRALSAAVSYASAWAVQRGAVVAGWVDDNRVIAGALTLLVGSAIWFTIETLRARRRVVYLPSPTPPVEPTIGAVPAEATAEAIPLHAEASYPFPARGGLPAFEIKVRRMWRMAGRRRADITFAVESSTPVDQWRELGDETRTTDLRLIVEGAEAAVISAEDWTTGRWQDAIAHVIDVPDAQDSASAYVVARFGSGAEARSPTFRIDL